MGPIRSLIGVVAMGAEDGLENLSIEERSNVEERKPGIVKEYQNYMTEHPELRQVMNDFICAVMTDKPKNIFKFARYWFKHSLPPLEELATAQATAPKAAAQDSENDPDLVQNIDHVKAVGTRQLLARIYAVLDADSDKVLTWEEFQSSPLYGILPDAVWSKMDLLPPVDDLPAQINALPSQDVR